MLSTTLSHLKSVVGELVEMAALAMFSINCEFLASDTFRRQAINFEALLIMSLLMKVSQIQKCGNTIILLLQVSNSKVGN